MGGELVERKAVGRAAIVGAAVGGAAGGGNGGDGDSGGGGNSGSGAISDTWRVLADVVRQCTTGFDMAVMFIVQLRPRASTLC